MGFLWPLKDAVYGNPEKGRKPIQPFISTVNQFPGLLDIMFSIEGLVNKRSSHASGVILFDENIYDTAAVMRTPTGALITQWDLHDTEYTGNTKYDLLLTSVQDTIIKTIELLQEDGLIEKDISLREVYNKYLHPSVLPLNDRIWEALANNEVIGCFQFDSPDGNKGAKKVKPNSIQEMSNTNGLIRLMTGEKGGEQPIDKYVRFKNDISQWYKEMREAGLSEQEQKSLEPYFLPEGGMIISQEGVMQVLQDPDVCNFTLAEANSARKIIGKKLMDKIPELHDKVISKAKTKELGEYVWKYGIGPSMGYSFSVVMALTHLTRLSRG